MKTKLIYPVLIVVALLSGFTQAAQIESAPTPKKVVSFTSNSHTRVLRFYANNRNYKTVYTPRSFMDEFCVNNPKFFKKRGCTDDAFRFLPSEKEWIFPALPETKSAKTTNWVYNHNEIFRLVYVKKNCEQEQKKRLFQKCAATALKQLKKTKNIKLVSLPETYLIKNQTADRITIDEKIYMRAERGSYYRLETRQHLEIKKDTASDLAMKAAVLSKKNQTETVVEAPLITPPESYIPGLTRQRTTTSENPGVKQEKVPRQKIEDKK